jgi:hypothetical protein
MKDLLPGAPIIPTLALPPLRGEGIVREERGVGQPARNAPTSPFLLLRSRRRPVRGWRRTIAGLWRPIGRRRRSVAGWRWRRPIGARRPDAGDLVSPRIHALPIGNVVTPLELIPGRSGRTARDSGSGEEAGACADCGSGACVARGGTHQRAEPGARQCSDGGPGGEVLIGGLAWRRSSYLLLGPLPARIIISLEYFKRLSGAGIHREGRAGGHRCASREQGRGKKYEKTSCPVHLTAPSSFPCGGGGVGATLIQPLGQFVTYG